MKSIFRFYKGLFGHYDKYALSGAYRVVRKQDNGSYTTAGWKAQIIGNTLVQAMLMSILYMGYRLGKEQARQEVLDLQTQQFRDYETAGTLAVQDMDVHNPWNLS
jgi:hypothetical protein